MREKEEEGEGEAQKVEQTVSGLLKKGEGAARRSDAQPCSVVCSLIAMPPCPKREKFRGRSLCVAKQKTLGGSRSCSVCANNDQEYLESRIVSRKKKWKAV